MYNRPFTGINSVETFDSACMGFVNPRPFMATCSSISFKRDENNGQSTATVRPFLGFGISV